MDHVISKRHKRLAAFFIDFMVYGLAQWFGSRMSIMIAMMLLNTPLAKNVSPSEVTTSLEMFGSFFWGTTVFMLNWGVFQGLTGQSFGKKVMGIRVIHEDGTPITVAQSIGRSMLYLVSSIPAWLGFLSIFMHKQARCIHDWICRTVVVDAHPAQAHSADPVPVSHALVPTVILLPDQNQKKAS